MHIFKVHRAICCCDLHLRARFPTDGGPYTNRYEYEGGSNLEVDGDDHILDNEPVGDPPVVTRRKCFRVLDHRHKIHY